MIPKLIWRKYSIKFMHNMFKLSLVVSSKKKIGNKAITEMIVDNILIYQQCGDLEQYRYMYIRIHTYNIDS